MGNGHSTCEVCGIKEKHTPGNKSLFFSKFPLDPNRCRVWLKVVGNEELAHLPIEKLHEQRNICGNHCRRNDFNVKGNRLKKHAIPTLSLMALPLTESQLAEFPQHVWTDRNVLASEPSTIEEKENIPDMQSQTGCLPVSVPSTSQQETNILVELSQNKQTPPKSRKRSAGEKKRKNKENKK